MSDEIIYSDRYTALGIEPNGCGGECEGTGFVPIYMFEGDKRLGEDNHAYPREEETDPAWIAAWRAAEAEHPSDDGYHFLRCPKCHPLARQ